MSTFIQWIIVGMCLAGALVYLLHCCGLFAWLGWIKPRAGDACGVCPGCSSSTIKSQQEKHLDA